MAEKKLRWGIISTARIGEKAVIPAIQASSNGEVVAVASRNGRRARRFARSSGIPRSYGSYEELFEDPEVDAVYNPLPNNLHLGPSVRAAENGKHVLCEKPITLDAAECERMQAAAEANGVLMMEAFMYRFHPQTERVIQLVRSGALGELRMIHAVFSFNLDQPKNIRWDPKLGGGALYDVGCYCVNVSRTLAGQEPVEVQAFARWSPHGVDAQVAGTLRFEDGLLAQIDCGFNMDNRQGCEVAGTGGSLEVPLPFLPGKKGATIWEKRGGGETIAHTIEGADQYQFMVEHFADCVLNERPLRYPLTEAAANMRTIDALYRSARDGGRPVQL